MAAQPAQVGGASPGPGRDAGADAAARGAAPLSSEAKRRVRLAEGGRKGFETAWNEYFDCYASTTYVARPIIRLEDVAYHLYLKKNINPTNPRWELPSFRQQKKTLGLSQDKIQGIEERLGAAGLLVKDSGVGKGRKGENVANEYVLYEPLELPEFLLAVAEGRLPGELTEKGQRRLAEFRARFALATEQGLPAAATQRTNGAAPDGVPIVGTPPAPITGAGDVPMVGAGGVPAGATHPAPEGRTPPEPAAGTHNRPLSTPVSQQTKQQQLALDAPASRPAVVDPHREADVVVAAIGGLVERGVTTAVATRLVRAHGAASAARQSEAFDFLREMAPDDPKISPGRLRRMIEEDWAPPAAFVPAAERGARERQEAEALARRGQERRETLAAQERRAAEATAVRLAALDAIGLTPADQVIWARLVGAPPALPLFFRDALFHAPRPGESSAAVIFRDAEALERARGAAHTAARARIARRVADEWRRPGLQVHYLLYDEVLRMLTEGEAGAGG